MTCEICQRRRPSLFITVEQTLFNKTMRSKAHVCTTCFNTVQRNQNETLRLTEVGQQEFNEAVV
jgi:protein-arginine kinase activator protein McsA